VGVVGEDISNGLMSNSDSLSMLSISWERKRERETGREGKEERGDKKTKFALTTERHKSIGGWFES
jgi:hypothetical protein